MERNLAGIGGVNYHGHQPHPPGIKHQVLGFPKFPTGDLPTLSCPDWVNLDHSRIALNFGGCGGQKTGRLS